MERMLRKALYAMPHHASRELRGNDKTVARRDFPARHLSTTLSKAMVLGQNLRVLVITVVTFDAQRLSVEHPQLRHLLRAFASLRLPQPSSVRIRRGT